MKQQTQPLLKFVVIGDSGVGKSSLLSRYCDNEFSDSFSTTVGVDFKIRSVALPGSGRKVKLQIWDTAGQERFRAMTRAYYRGAQAVLLVFAVNNAESFASLATWFSEAQLHSGTPMNVAVLANKCDAENEQTVSHKMARHWAEAQSMRYYEVSAKSGNGVAECFQHLAEIVVSQMQIAPPLPLPPVEAVEAVAERSRCCF